MEFVLLFSVSSANGDIPNADSYSKWTYYWERRWFETGNIARNNLCTVTGEFLEFWWDRYTQFFWCSTILEGTSYRKRFRHVFLDYGGRHQVSCFKTTEGLSPSLTLLFWISSTTFATSGAPNDLHSPELCCSCFNAVTSKHAISWRLP